MAKIIKTSNNIVLTPENEAHLQAVAANHGWNEIEDVHIYTRVEQPPLTPEVEAWAMKVIAELGQLDKKRVP